MNQILYSFQICFFLEVLHFLIMIYNHVLELGYSIVNALSIRAPTSIGKCLFIYLWLFTQKYLKSFYFPAFVSTKSVNSPIEHLIRCTSDLVI